MGYIFEWDPIKAESNARKHGVTFDEAVTAFRDPLSLLLSDPDHSVGQERYLVLGMSNQRRLLGSGCCRAATTHPPDLSKAGHAIGAEAI